MGFVTSTFTSASSDTANYADVPYTFGPSTIQEGTKDQLLGFSAYGDSATGTAVIEVVIIDKNTNLVVWSEQAVVTAGTRRTATANSSGSYLCSIIFTTSQRNTTDLLMCPVGNAFGNFYVKFGCPTLTTFTTLTVNAVASGLL